MPVHLDSIEVEFEGQGHSHRRIIVAKVVGATSSECFYIHFCSTIQLLLYLFCYISLSH